MIKEFRVCQVFKLRNGGTGVSIDVKPEEKIDICKVDMSKESNKYLWDFCKGDWETEKVAEVEFEKYCEDGYTPLNPIIKHVKYKN